MNPLRPDTAITADCKLRFARAEECRISLAAEAGLPEGLQSQGMVLGGLGLSGSGVELQRSVKIPVWGAVESGC